MVLMSTCGLCSINQSALFDGLIVKGENAICCELKIVLPGELLACILSTLQVLDGIFNLLTILTL